MGAVAGVCVLGGTILGLVIFGLMVLLGATEFQVIGAVGIGVLLYGFYSFIRNPV
jgi:hypothetical protein